MKLTFLFAFLAVHVSAINWPQFRGPQACGVDSNAPAPTRWDVEKGENVSWRASIPGLGHSSPILWGDRIYVTTAAQVHSGKAELKVGLYGDIKPTADEGPQQWRLLALDKADGKILWNKVGHESAPRTKRHPKGSHCSSSPATDGQRIVAIFGSEGLFCFDMEGKPLWKKDLGPMVSAYYVVPSAEWGFASSPILHENKVVVLCDVLTNSFIAVFDAKSGEQLWRTPRKDVPTWGSPTIAKSADLTQILVNGWHETAGYDFATGKELWKLDGGGDIPAPTPIFANGLAYFTSGHGPLHPMRAIRLDARGDLKATETGETNKAIAWDHPRKGNYMQTPILVGSNLYGCYDIGLLTCFDAVTGKIHFSERLGNGSEGFTSSPVSDGRNLFIASEVGRVYVVPVTDKFSVIATNNLGQDCMASPAISEGTLFYRTRDQLVAIASGKK